MDNKAEELKRRLEALEQNPEFPDHPLMNDVRFFANEGVKSARTLDKLIKISDAMQDQVVRQRTELEEINKQKNLLFTVIAHDLRSPLGLLMTGVDLLGVKNDALGETDRKELIDILARKSRQVVALLENLLNWAGLQMKNIPFEPIAINLEDAFTSLKFQTAIQAEAKGIRLKFQSNGLRVMADRNMLDAILRNLIGNAVKFTPRDGEIEVVASQAGKRVEIRVSDAGVGMDAATLANVFNLGGTTPAYGTEKERGSGLGLALCREMVEKHGGALKAESVLGEGSRFHFTLAPVDD